MITKCDSLKVADKVLQGIKKFKASKKMKLILQCYQNGREQGYMLNRMDVVSRLYVSFSECRNSDQIVVYVDDKDNMQSISDNAYNNKTFFCPDDHMKAAHYIVDLFEKQK